MQATYSLITVRSTWLSRFEESSPAPTWLETSRRAAMAREREGCGNGLNTRKLAEKTATYEKPAAFGRISPATQASSVDTTTPPMPTERGAPNGSGIDEAS